MFNSVSEQHLSQLIKDELQNIEIRSVDYDSRSHSMEYAQIYFIHHGNEIQHPYIEIIDDCFLSIGPGSMTYAFQSDDDLDLFVGFTAVTIKAQDFIFENPPSIKKFLNRFNIADQCYEQNYYLRLNPNKMALDKWQLFNVSEDLMDSYMSLAAVDTAMRNSLNDFYY
jgi:hypothetical protein